MEERIIAALDELSARGDWQALVSAGVIVLSFIGLAVCLYRLRSYNEEKGKNLATKEDVAELTRLAEQVRHEFESLHEASSQQNRLQLAALDKRLEAHQRAFAVWHLFADAFQLSESRPRPDDKAVSVARERFTALWRDHSLYLDRKTREAIAELTGRHGQRIEMIRDCDKLYQEGLRLIDPPQGADDFVIDAERHRKWEARNAESIAELEARSAARRRQCLEPIESRIFETRELIEQGVHLPPLGAEPPSDRA